MAPNPRRIHARLEAIYARIPPMANCRGACADSCGPITMSIAERERIRRDGGVDIPPQEDLLASGCLDCPALTVTGRCSVYSIRPGICRLWGAVPSMPCPRHCQPVGGMLDDQTGAMILYDLFEVGGWPPGWPQPTREAFTEVVFNGEGRRLLAQLAAGEVPEAVAVRQLARRLQ